MRRRLPSEPRSWLKSSVINALSHSCTHHTQQLLIALAPVVVVVVVVVVGCAFYRINNTGSTPESEYKPFVMENHAIILAMLKERFNDFESTKGR
jgi:xanthine/uracil permease